MARVKVSKKSKSILVGIICGACCALCVALYVMSVDEQANAAEADMLAKYGGDQVEVCVARRNIVAGETIRDSDIETKKWIATLLPVDAVASKDEVVGKQVGSTILTGEVISSARFGFKTTDIEVPDGLSALSVPAQAVQAVGGSLAPGMKADIYAVGASSTTRISTSALILATSMQEDSIASTSSNAWITLAVKPESVQELVSAAESTKLYFVLPSADASTSTDDANAASAINTADASDIASTSNTTNTTNTTNTNDTANKVNVTSATNTTKTREGN